ncbi:hypothetical protein F383_38243 [Gossypium arboreum]|nr:hypothetical protein F383_38243 [Gossypium arboreum]
MPKSPQKWPFSE